MCNITKTRLLLANNYNKPSYLLAYILAKTHTQTSAVGGPFFFCLVNCKLVKQRECATENARHQPVPYLPIENSGTNTRHLQYTSVGYSENGKQRHSTIWNGTKLIVTTIRTKANVQALPNGVTIVYFQIYKIYKMVYKMFVLLFIFIYECSLYSRYMRAIYILYMF